MTTPSSEPTSDKTPPDTTTGPSCDTAKTPTTGSSEPEASGMTTRITVIDGMNGHTPEMLRYRKRLKQLEDELFDDIARIKRRIYQDPMHD